MNGQRQGKPWQALLLVAVGAALVVGAAQEPGNDYHFSVMGDRTGGHHPGIYERVWSEIDLLQPQFVMNVGDTIEGYIRDPNVIEAQANSQWDEISSIQRPYRQLPLYNTPGNHDIWNDTAEQIYKDRTGQETHYAFTYQSSLFVILDNSRNRELSDEMYTFLEDQLKANPDRGPKYIFFHQPFWLGYVAAGDTNARLHQLCKQYQVDWVITGHGHTLVYQPFDGVDYLEVGSSGGGIGLHPDGMPNINFAMGKFFHHVFIRVKGTQVKVTVKELGGRAGEGRMFPIEAWRGNTPMWPMGTDINDHYQKMSRVRLFGIENQQQIVRGIVPLLALDSNQMPDPPVISVQETPVEPMAKDFVGVALEVNDLHSVDNMDCLYVNDELIARMSPNRNLLRWAWVAYPVSKEVWTRQTPPVIKITAGTPQDGSGANPEANNDDYAFRNLFATDGEKTYRSSTFNTGEMYLGDNREGAKTEAILPMDVPGPAPAGRLTLHEWDTRDLPAGRYIVSAELGRGRDDVDVELP